MTISIRIKKGRNCSFEYKLTTVNKTPPKDKTMFDKDLFANPPAEYTPIPFWFWNGDMDDKEIVFELEQMKQQGVFEAIIHARKGLAFGYLSSTWFAKVGLALETASRLGMRLWIYDESDWPSGYAGGKVVASDPSFSAKCLSVEKIYPLLGQPVIVKEKPGSPIVAVVAVYQDKEFIDITSYGREGKDPWHSATLCWEVFVFRMEECFHRPAYSDAPYVDLMNDEATEAFISLTHAEYKKHFPQYWGNLLKGFFTDEPGFYQNYLEQDKNINTIAWTPSFSERFKKKFGYDLLPYLPSLWQNMPISKKIRADYYAALDLFYRESFFDKISSYLHQNGLLLMGHLHREDKLAWLVQTEGSFFKVIDGLDYAGIDRIERTYPRVSERLCGSAADLLGKQRSMCEIFGAFGWTLTPTEMKRFLDREFAQGINMIVPHAFFSSIEGFREKESPPSLFYQNDYWPHFSSFSNYISRLSYALSQGKHRPRVALYYPEALCQKLFMPLSNREVCDIDDCLDRIVGALNSSGVDFLLINEEQLGKGVLEEGNLRVGDFSFDTLFLPCSPDESIYSVIKDFSKHGGRVVVFDKKKNPDFAPCSYFYFAEEDVIKGLLPMLGRGFDGDNVLAYSRLGEGWKLLFLVNESNQENSLSIHVEEGHSVEEWNAETGQFFRLYDKGKGRSEPLTLARDEAKLLLIHKGESSAPKKKGFSQVPLLLKEALFNGVKYPQASAHGNGLVNFVGQIELRYSFSLSEKNEHVSIGFCDIKDFATLYVDGKEVSTCLYPPFNFPVGVLGKGEHEVLLKVGMVKANAIERSDLDAGAFKEAFVCLEQE